LERAGMVLWFAKSTSVNITAFSCTSETKMHHFTLFLMAAGSQHGDFQTFLDFEKTKAL